MRLVTWNVNGLRARAAHVDQVIEALQPDVLMLQEIKMDAAIFPVEAFAAAGLPHTCAHGFKGKHGVAIASRHPLKEIDRTVIGGVDDGRHVSATLATSGGDLRVSSLYVPSGGDKPDVAINDKFAHKLAFMEEMKTFFAGDGLHVAGGDLNIAPQEHDVHNHKKCRRLVGHSDGERQIMAEAIEAGGWIDTGRAVQPEGPLFTWWGYRYPPAFERNMGWRLDHLWLKRAHAELILRGSVFRESRAWEKPSDHAPVVLDLGLDAA